MTSEQKITNFWVSGIYATGLVQIDDEGIILDTAPIFQRFRGQCIESLMKHLKKKSQVKIEEIP